MFLDLSIFEESLAKSLPNPYVLYFSTDDRVILIGNTMTLNTFYDQVFFIALFPRECHCLHGSCSDSHLEITSLLKELSSHEQSVHPNDWQWLVWIKQPPQQGLLFNQFLLHVPLPMSEAFSSSKQPIWNKKHPRLFKRYHAFTCRWSSFGLKAPLTSMMKSLLM